MTLPYQQASASFLGLIDEVTGVPAGNVARLQQSFPLSHSQAVVVTAIWVKSALAGTGPTRVVAADAAYNGAATATIKATLAAADLRTAPVAGSIELDAGASLYVYFELAGQHGNVELAVEYRPVWTQDEVAAGTLLAAVVIDRARYLLGDEAKTAASDARMLEWLAEGQQRVLTRRPALRWDATGTARAAIPDTVALGSTLVLGYPWVDWLVRWVMCWWRIALDPDKANREAARQDYEQLLAELG